jgi:hypothetical protein
VKYEAIKAIFEPVSNAKFLALFLSVANAVPTGIRFRGCDEGALIDINKETHACQRNIPSQGRNHCSSGCQTTFH